MLPQSPQDTGNRQDLQINPIHTSVIYQIPCIDRVSDQHGKNSLTSTCDIAIKHMTKEHYLLSNCRVMALHSAVLEHLTCKFSSGR